MARLLVAAHNIAKVRYLFYNLGCGYHPSPAPKILVSLLVDSILFAVLIISSGLLLATLIGDILDRNVHSHQRQYRDI